MLRFYTVQCSYNAQTLFLLNALASLMYYGWNIILHLFKMMFVYTEPQSRPFFLDIA